jgi:exodeoxyribonuclease-3
MLRLLSYNIRHGGAGRVEAIASVIRACRPDVVLLQEATRPDVVRALAAETGLPEHGSHRGRSLGFLSKLAVARSVWRRPLVSRHAFLELTLAGSDVHLIGVHLSAVHAAWTERRRLMELASLLRTVKARQPGFHVLAGDFNTLAPGELLDVRRLPPRLRPLVWLSGGSIRWKTVAAVLAAGYADAWRSLHPEGDGATFPTWGRHLRLDYVFAPAPAIGRIVRCEVVDGVDTARASDHHPLLAEIDAGVESDAGAPTPAS